MEMVLAIDTAGPLLGVAVAEAAEGAGEPAIRASWSARIGRGAEEHLVRVLEDLLGTQRPACVGVTVGPGAFTGLRVGVATALGVASALGCPVVPLSSLEARALLVPGHPRVLALLDARKGRFYAGLYDTTGPFPVLVGEEGDLPIEGVLPPAPFLAVGEGARVAVAAIRAAGGSVVPASDRGVASCAAFLASLRWRAGAAVPAEQVRLRYLRPADATIPSASNLAGRPGPGAVPAPVSEPGTGT